jgi:hypothetical protein
MEYKEILKIIAPCGLNCYKCFAYKDGAIRKTSIKLQSLLGSFDIYAERFSSFLPIFKKYPSFKDLLIYLTEENCLGCRQGSCLYPDCGVRDCYKTKNIDFCFQCDLFPCQKTNFDAHLERRWRQINNRMKEIGIEAYYQETKNIPRY